MSHRHWPLFDLEVRTPRITLRYADDELAIALAELAANGVHDPAFMPFAMPWTDAPAGELERNTLQYHWLARAEHSPTKWNILFAVIADGAVVGSTGLMAEHFPTLRTFETGSWLGRGHQGHGLGKEMRAASLHLGFAGLEAEEATTGAYEDNAPSLGVTRSLGYAENGVRRNLRRDHADTIRMFRMGREHWETIRRDDIELVGTEPVRSFLGL